VVPLNWKPPKVFYGWWVVSASSLIALYAGGIIFYGFTAIFEPIANEFGWSYAQISLAASIRGVEMGLLSPLFGMLADRWGPRRLIFSGGVITALGLILLSYTTSLAMFYGAFVLVAIGISACSMTVLMIAVANWFKRRVGLASGIAASGFGFGGLLVPVVVRLIDIYEWRMATIILAAGILATVLPLSLLFRHKPEQYGCLPDGEVKGPIAYNDGLAPLKTAEAGVKAKQALRTRTFWHLAFAFTWHSMLVNAVVTHIMPYLSSIGITRSISSLIATANPLLSIGGRLGVGWVGDKLDRKRVAAGALAMMAFGLFSFGYATSTEIWLLVPFLILFGIGYGGSIAMRPSLVREFFGRTSFGTIFGLLMGIGNLGGIIGPLLAGWVFDTWSSYQGIWFTFAGLAVAAVISVLTAPPVSTKIIAS